jgi:hypothetical protein
VLSGRTDEEVLDWCFTSSRRLTEEEILIYNSLLANEAGMMMRPRSSLT